MEKDVKSGVEEPPTPEKSVMDLIQESEAPEVAEETTEESTEEATEESAETTEETEEASEESVEEEPEERQVPVKALQRERQKRREAEARAREHEARLAALEAQKRPAETLERPDVRKFDTQEEYLEAMSNYLEKKAEIVADEKVTKKLVATTEAERQAEIVRQQEREAEDFAKRLDKGKGKFKDFDESFEYVSELARPSRALVRAIITSDVPVDVINYLAKNPTVAEGLSDLSPESQVKAIGVIEDKIKSPPKPKKITKAPAPIDAVGSSSPPSKVPFRENMTPEEYSAWRKQADDRPISELLG